MKTILFLILLSPNLFASEFVIGRLKYSGGGDWYANPTSIPNWLKILKKELGVRLKITEKVVSLKDESCFKADLLYATGHGNLGFTRREAQNLQRYLSSGGFLWVDDNYGMDRYFRRNIRQVFPDKELQPIGSKHPIYHSYFELQGLPKVHEHDGKPAQGYGIFQEERMVVFYSYSSDIGDGLEDPGVHKDPENLRDLARKFAVNLVYFLMNAQRAPEVRGGS